MKLTELKDRIRSRREQYRQRRLIAEFERSRSPWTPGYFLARERYVTDAISNPRLIASFKSRSGLPERFGVEFDERVVEYPWAISQLEQLGEGTLLDAGSCLNFLNLLQHPALAKKSVTIVNLQPEVNCYWLRGVSYLFCDLRNMPLREGWFDLVTCLSTLEHIGMDNSSYTGQLSEIRPEDYKLAVAELIRVLKPGGTALITVPFGEYRNAGSFQQFDVSMVEYLRSCFSESEVSYCIYQSGGWQFCSAEECSKPSADAISSGAVALLKARKRMI